MSSGLNFAQWGISVRFTIMEPHSGSIGRLQLPPLKVFHYIRKVHNPEFSVNYNPLADLIEASGLMPTSFYLFKVNNIISEKM